MELLKFYDRVKHDNTAKRPRMLTWDITNKCNLSCKHCLNNSGDSKCHDFSKELSKEKQIELAHKIAKLKPAQCCLCGGETLLNDNIYDIITIISSSGVMVNMVTNGLLLTDEVAQKLKKSGVSNVQVSIDGLGWQHNMFRNKIGAFDKSVEAIRILQNNGISVMVSCCPNKFNAGSIETYVDYMYGVLGVKNIRMMPLLPLGRAHKECEKLFLSNKEYFYLVQKIIKLRKKYSDLDLEWGDPLEHLFLVLYSKRKYPIVMSIASNGDLTVTPYIPIVLGNVTNEDLINVWESGYKKIWSNKEILDIIRKVKTIYDLEKFGENILIQSWKNI